MTDKQVYLSVRLPRTLRELVKVHVSRGLHMNESDFIRESIREKLQREAPDLYRGLGEKSSELKTRKQKP